MIRFTTPTLSVTVPELLSGADVYLTITQKGSIVTKKNADLRMEEDEDEETTTIYADLSQEDSSKFELGSAEVQVNWLKNGIRQATDIRKITIARNLLEEVI